MSAMSVSYEIKLWSSYNCLVLKALSASPIKSNSTLASSNFRLFSVLTVSFIPSLTFILLAIVCGYLKRLNVFFFLFKRHLHRTEIKVNADTLPRSVNTVISSCLSLVSDSSMHLVSLILQFFSLA